MKCFQCRKEIENESSMVHLGDGDFVHDQCKAVYERERDDFFNNIGDDSWYNEWLKK